jgi:hypothetical protein
MKENVSYKKLMDVFNSHSRTTEIMIEVDSKGGCFNFFSINLKSVKNLRTEYLQQSVYNRIRNSSRSE